MDGIENNDREEIFSKAIRAGKRTYFFDVKTTKGNDYYLTVTESKKRFTEDGKFSYEKHKLFLYKEDFAKFSEGLKEAIDFIRTAQPELPKAAEDTTAPASSFADVNFEDLDK